MPRAPKVCNEPNCPNLVHDPTKRRCEEHYQPWQGHKRHKGIAHRAMRENTKEHKEFRDVVLQKAQYRCVVLQPARCTGLATEVDRIDNDQGYTEGNCQALCHECHVWKTSMEGHRARGHNVG
jgi:hypothetical protein